MQGRLGLGVHDPMPFLLAWALWLRVTVATAQFQWPHKAPSGWLSKQWLPFQLFWVGSLPGPLRGLPFASPGQGESELNI